MPNGTSGLNLQNMSLADLQQLYQALLAHLRGQTSTPSVPLKKFAPPAVPQLTVPKAPAAGYSGQSPMGLYNMAQLYKGLGGGVVNPYPTGTAPESTIMDPYGYSTR